MTNKHREENELLEMWKDYEKTIETYYEEFIEYQEAGVSYRKYRLRFKDRILHYYQLKAKMDSLIDEILRLNGEIALAWGNYNGLNKLYQEKLEVVKDQKKQILSMENDMEWFYNRGKEDMYLSKGQGRNFKDAWNIYSYGLKKGEKRG